MEVGDRVISQDWVGVIEEIFEEGTVETPTGELRTLLPPFLPPFPHSRFLKLTSTLPPPLPPLRRNLESSRHGSHARYRSTRQRTLPTWNDRPSPSLDVHLVFLRRCWSSSSEGYLQGGRRVRSGYGHLCQLDCYQSDGESTETPIGEEEEMRLTRVMWARSSW